MKETLKTKKISVPQQKGILAVTMGIISSGSARLVSISEKMYSQNANCVKSFLNRLSYLLKCRNIGKLTANFHKNFASQSLKKLKVYTYKNKRVALTDWTAYRKRSRKAKKNKGMQWVGQVWDGREKKPVTGYGGLLTGLLLENGKMLPITHRLYSNKYMESHPKSCRSMNQIEEDSVKDLKEIAGDNLLLIGDRHFANKNFLYKLKKRENIDFLMRIKKGVNITTEEKEEWINIYKQSMNIRKSYPVSWYYVKKNKSEKCKAKVFKAKLFAPDSRKKLAVWVVTIESKSAAKKEPIVLVSSFKITPEDLQDITNLYKKRWIIETTIETLKQNFGLEKIMVRKWRAIEAMIFLTLLAYALVLFIWLTSKKMILAAVIILLRKTTVLTRGKLSIAKWRYGIGILICKPLSI
jgi:hypothetical protein